MTSTELNHGSGWVDGERGFGNGAGRCYALPHANARKPLEHTMPTISMFYGILVMMYFRDNRRHHLPHVHVRYQDNEAAISIEDGSLIEGTLPRKQLKLVEAWIEIHKEDLMVDWQLAVNGEEPFRIPPLQ